MASLRDQFNFVPPPGYDFGYGRRPVPAYTEYYKPPRSYYGGAADYGRGYAKPDTSLLPTEAAHARLVNPDAPTPSELAAAAPKPQPRTIYETTGYRAAAVTNALAGAAIGALLFGTAAYIFAEDVRSWLKKSEATLVLCGTAIGVGIGLSIALRAPLMQAAYSQVVNAKA